MKMMLGLSAAYAGPANAPARAAKTNIRFVMINSRPARSPSRGRESRPPPAARAAIDRMSPIERGPRDKLVDGERHLTLTGWDRTDYADFLGRKPDAVVLQMANADVTDDTLALLADMTRLRRLDVSHSQVTD